MRRDSLKKWFSRTTYSLAIKKLVDLINKLDEDKVQFKSVTDDIDTTTVGRFFFHTMASLAQMEAERTKAGLDAARLLGRVGGRKK